MLVSARDTSGDFFDFFTLPDGRVGIVLADVADKGIGAALYMALSRAYLRSLALEKDPYPPATLAALNRRILQDTSSDLFVTLVYGMISPGNGRFIYCNGGHPPPLVVRSNPSQPIELLARTGMAVGVTENTEWEEGSIELSPGDYILMYSDGITEAQSDAGEFFGLERLISGVEAMRGWPPAEVREYLIQRVQDFSGDVQEDDIALLVLCKTG
jgi:sigma-B regulation protein RsbU (phosphoserine phosphatase)